MNAYLDPLLCFLGYAGAAFLWTIIVLVVNKDEITKAVLIGMIQTLFSLITIKLVVADAGTLSTVTAVLGDGFGMAAAMYMERRRKRRKKETGEHRG